MKETYIDLLKSTDRKGIDNLIDWLENESDFFTAPASTKYHLNREKGLLEHSLNVYKNLDNDLFYNAYDKYSENTVIIVSLLHDICKANFYKTSERNIKKDDKWVKENYYTIDDLYPVGHGEKSVIIAQKFINLSDEEIMAIRWHMGFSESKDNYNYVSKAFSMYPLALYLHMADLKATYIDENMEEK